MAYCIYTVGTTPSSIKTLNRKWHMHSLIQLLPFFFLQSEYFNWLWWSWKNQRLWVCTRSTESVRGWAELIHSKDVREIGGVFPLWTHKWQVFCQVRCLQLWCGKNYNLSLFVEIMCRYLLCKWHSPAYTVLFCRLLVHVLITIGGSWNFYGGKSIRGRKGRLQVGTYVF